MTDHESTVGIPIVESTPNLEMRRFDSNILIAAWASKIELFLKANDKIGLDRLTRFSEWGIPAAEIFPRDANGRHRALLNHEFRKIVNGVMTSLGYTEEHSSVTSFFTDVSGEFAYQMRNFLRDETWLRQTMKECYPAYTLIPLGRDGIIMILRQYFEQFGHDDPNLKSIYYPGFQYDFVGNFHATEEVHRMIARSAQVTMAEAIQGVLGDLSENSPVAATTEEQDTPSFHKLPTLESHELATERFIVTFNRFLDTHPQELQFLQFFLQKQIDFLAIKENGKIVLYDTLASGKSLLTVAALVKRLRPDVDVRILISSSKAFSANDREYYELADINLTLHGVANAPREPSWPFKFDGFNEPTGLPEFSANPEKILEWIMNVLLAYNRAVISNDDEIIEKLETSGDQISDTLPSSFLNYVFPDSIPSD